MPRDNYTYSTLLSICQAGGQLATALRLFKEMQEEGLTPNTGAFVWKFKLSLCDCCELACSETCRRRASPSTPVSLFGGFRLAFAGSL